MIKMTVPLRAVSPLFLAGSEPRGAPELRPASFRGALRFWLRTLLGSSLDYQSLDRLREAETMVFGDAGEDSGSPIVVRVAGAPPSGRFTPSSDPGVRYLFFSMGQRDRDPRTGQTTTIWRDCFPPNSDFSLILQTRLPGSSPNLELALRRAAAALWLLVYLGGLGARSRRGAGSLQATGEPSGWSDKLPPLRVQATTPAQLAVELRNGLRSLREATSLPLLQAMRVPSAFDVLHPDVTDIHVLNHTWPTWQDALEAVGAAFQGFRNRFPPDDYRTVKGVISGQSQRLEPVQRAAFGLPIVFYFRSLGGARGTLQGSEHDRRASPLLIKPVRLANGQHTVVFTIFRASLLGRSERGSEQLKLMPRGRPAYAPTPDFGLVDEFLETISSQGDSYVAPLLEVDYR
ncbi:MAG: type III-B CRISPR module RAMP protein Cmr1 [Chloroflexi bacterium]|nr:type III-B CRISPR module RAMP protein Cmr1 [Chloroflexota bacterium]